MFRLIFPSRYHRGRWLSAAAPILSDPTPKADPKAWQKIRRSSPESNESTLTVDAMGSSDGARFSDRIKISTYCVEVRIGVCLATALPTVNGREQEHNLATPTGRAQS